MRGFIFVRPASAARYLLPALLVTVSLLALTGTVTGATAESDQAKVMHKAALAYMSVAKEMISRGRYADAADSLAKATDNSKYLTDPELKTLNGMLETIRSKTMGRQEGVQHMDAAKGLIADKQYIKAKPHLDAAAKNEFLTATEKALVKSLTKQNDTGIKTQTVAMKMVYDKSVEQFEAGQLDKARAGFTQVAASGVVSAPAGKSPENYLGLIAKAEDAKAAAAASPVAPAATTEPNPAELIDARPVAVRPVAEPSAVVVETPAPAVSVSAEPMAPAAVAVDEVPAAQPANNSYMDQVMQQRRRVQSYVEATVESAMQNARVAATSGQFDVARSEISLAMQTVEERKSVLGADFYGKYMDQLSLMSKQISQDETQARKLNDAKALAEAENSKKVMRSQQEAARDKKIREYLDNAATLQEETRYEAALGALEQVLAIDPLNQTAKIQKSLIEKLVIYRNYRDAKTLEAREEQKLRVEVTRNAIPYVDDITYPNDWRELEKRRMVKDKNSFVALEDSEVYAQLTKVVSLSQLTPETPLSEAIDLMKNSVQPPLYIHVMWTALRNSNLSQASPIGMEGPPKTKLSQALDLLLNSINSSAGITDTPQACAYAVQNGMVVIGTLETLRNTSKEYQGFVARIYPIGDIAGVSANYVAGDASSSGGTGSTGSTGGGTSTSTTSAGSSSGSSTGASTGGGTGGGTSGGTSSGTSSSGSSSGGNSGGGSALGDSDGRLTNADNLIIRLKSSTTDPLSWDDNGGEGTMQNMDGTSLLVYQTPKIHGEITEILANLRQHLGEQVAIEARFLLLDEKFIEELGLDMDFQFNKLGGKFGIMNVAQNSSGAAAAADLTSRAISASGTYGGILDDIQVRFLLNATQQNTNSMIFNAPKVTVLNDETASLSVTNNQYYISNWQPGALITNNSTTSFQPAYPIRSSIPGGIALSIWPSISRDRKYVFMNIRTSLSDYSFTQTEIPVVVDAQGTIVMQQLSLPKQDTTITETRVYVPDKGTLLIGGQKIKQHTEVESGVPMLGKLPYVGRLFSNRSKVEETKVLLILVRPIIIFTSEAEEDHVASLTEATK